MGRTGHRRRALRRGLPLFAFLLLAACAGPAYYWQAASGHLRLMNARQDIDSLLADPETDPGLRARLQTAAEILRFAEGRLDLPHDGNYQTLVEVGGPVTWNVVATPEFSLTPKRWCFPVAGCVQYRGYFNEAAARRFAGRMGRRGFDVAVLPALAYSTLGWFDDPLLDTMLSRPPALLAGSLLHELAHQRLYVRGDTQFSEAYASFLERVGVRAWLEATGRDDERQRWEQRLQATRQFDVLLGRLRRGLAALYASGLGEAALRAGKAERFHDFRNAYEHLRATRWNGRDYFLSWLGDELNNAHVAMLEAYAGRHCAFAAVLREAGGDFAAFHRRVEALSRLDDDQRRTWLHRDCGSVASAVQL